MKKYQILFTILIILAIIVVVLIALKYGKRYLNEKENQEVVEVFSREIEKGNENETIQMNGYNVIGIVKIPKIGIEYPILDLDTYNPEETKEPMRISIVKYWGGKVNDYGNLSIAGHNNYDGSMFGKTKKLQKGDQVQLTDLEGQTITYEIYDIFVTDPNDVTILESTNQEIREVTLITCTNGNKERLILKAKEIM